MTNGTKEKLYKAKKKKKKEKKRKATKIHMFKHQGSESKSVRKRGTKTVHKFLQGNKLRTV